MSRSFYSEPALSSNSLTVVPYSAAKRLRLNGEMALKEQRRRDADAEARRPRLRKSEDL